MEQDEIEAVAALEEALKQLRIATHACVQAGLSHENVIDPLCAAHKLAKTVCAVVKGEA